MRNDHRIPLAEAWDRPSRRLDPRRAIFDSPSPVRRLDHAEDIRVTESPTIIEARREAYARAIEDAKQLVRARASYSISMPLYDLADDIHSLVNPYGGDEGKSGAV